MKRVVILLTLLIFSLNPAFSEVAVVESEPLPNIFIWAIPDDEDGAARVLSVVRSARQEQAHRPIGAVGLGTGEHGALHPGGVRTAYPLPAYTHGTFRHARGLSHSGTYLGTGGPGAAYDADGVFSD